MDNTRRVKNVLVFNLEQFQEDLVRELINNDISYVRVGNEFHFLDKIYRFFDFSLINESSIFHDIAFSDGVLFNPMEENFMCPRIENIFEEKKKVSYTKKKIKEAVPLWSAEHLLFSLVLLWYTVL